MPNLIPEKMWTHISADFIMKLPLAQGYDSILVVVDRFTKIAHFIPTTEKTSAEGLARLFRDNIWKLHGLPDSIISDRGPQFMAGIMKELNHMLGIKIKLSTAFHTQTWPDRKNEPGVGTVSLDVHRPSTRAVARMVGYGRICLQQQSAHRN